MREFIDRLHWLRIGRHFGAYPLREGRIRFGLSLFRRGLGIHRDGIVVLRRMREVIDCLRGRVRIGRHFGA